MIKKSNGYVFSQQKIDTDVVNNIIREIDFEADLQNCFTELEVYCDELELQF
ncbi:hypothetical protein M3Y14_31055 (plasmid) [Bacillus thuringiensis]|uniref:hypothetical protein n=1 Tax=Bacillus thuringiensis TaxID=1428 RepID=UPI002225AAF9|nr:hypothetical protein [Bacillus thuringiensis]UYX55720.1 hypothetical protein M3Y14_31055 [Bacillus thuringiensis]